MAITTTINSKTASGDKRIVEGKSVLSGGDSTGDVATGLSVVDQFFLIAAGGTQMTCSVDETLPLASGDVSVVIETANSTFYWMAIGR